MGGWTRLPKRLGAVTVGHKCHGGWYLPSGRQRLGIGWAPWRGGYLPLFQCIPGSGGGGGHTVATMFAVCVGAEGVLSADHFSDGVVTTVPTGTASPSHAMTTR